MSWYVRSSEKELALSGSVSLCMNGMITAECDLPLFIISTMAVLSEWISIDFLNHSCPQRMAAIIMGYIS